MFKTLLALFFFFLFSACSVGNPQIQIKFKTPDGHVTPIVLSEVVNTQAARSLGLMYRKELGRLEGMFFVFPVEEELSFWMKNTYLELDIIFIDRSMKVVSVVHRAVPLSETPRKSAGPVKYVLEVNGGLAKELGIDVGSSAEIIGEIPLAR